MRRQAHTCGDVWKEPEGPLCGEVGPLRMCGRADGFHWDDTHVSSSKTDHIEEAEI